MIPMIQAYYKHFALNFGQALQGLHYLGTHPDVDAVAARGTVRHALLSIQLRSRRVLNDLFFALIPPQWHHTDEELKAMLSIPARQWFQYGYCAWRFTDTGIVKENLEGVDRRWDPRCR